MSRGRAAVSCAIGSWLAVPAWFLFAAAFRYFASFMPFPAGTIILMTAFGLAILVAIALGLGAGAMWGANSTARLAWRVLGVMLGIGSAVAAFPAGAIALKTFAAIGASSCGLPADAPS